MKKQFDFIVIGSGLAGLTSSLTLAKFGKVLLVTKGAMSEGSTGWAQGGIAAVTSEKDSTLSHLEDTMKSGAYHNDRGAVKFLVEHAASAISWLESQGVIFDKKSSGGFASGLEGGHSFPRIIHSTDFTGRIIEHTLIERIFQNRKIFIWEYAMALDLLVYRGKCEGIQVIHADKVENIFSKAVVIATGGLGQIFQWTTNPVVSTGDGIAIAGRAGARLADLEFIQFHPTALKHGNSPLFLLSEALRGEGAYLKKLKVKSFRPKADQPLAEKFKVNGERFMHLVHPMAELAPRDIVTRAIVAEQKKGFEVYLDIRHREKEFLQNRFPNISRELEKRGFDLCRDLIPVTPAAHYSCGGIKVDLHGRTSVKNLYAFGEAASTGVHGANRLASNSLLEAVIFPLQLLHIQSELSNITVPIAGQSKKIRVTTQKESADVLELKRQLQKLMWEKVGVVRTRQGLEEAHRQISIWIKKISLLKNKGAIYELQNMLLTGRLIIEAALKRKKSLGAHYLA